MEQNIQPSSKTKKIKLDFKDSKYATGRRKRSIAKVWVKKGSGNIHVNGLKMNEYFKRPVHQIIVTRPLQISEETISVERKCFFAKVLLPEPEAPIKMMSDSSGMVNVFIFLPPFH